VYEPNAMLVPARDGDSVVGGRERPAQPPRVKECLYEYVRNGTVICVRGTR